MALTFNNDCHTYCIKQALALVSAVVFLCDQKRSYVPVVLVGVHAKNATSTLLVMLLYSFTLYCMRWQAFA